MAAFRTTWRWNIPASAWMVDIADADGTPILCGLSVVTGANLLEQMEYLGFSGQLFAQTDHAPDAVPTFENLGKEGRVYFLSP